MRQVFRDIELDGSFTKNGYVTTPLLNEKEVEQLRYLYRSNTSTEFGEGFHTSFLSKDVEFKKIVSSSFKEMFMQKLDKILIDYRVLFTHYLIKEANTSFKFDLSFSHPQKTRICLGLLSL